MGQTAEELRAQAEVQRTELSRDLEAIGDRISPSRMVDRRRAAIGQTLNRARDAVMGRADMAKSQAGDTRSTAGSSVSGAAASVGQRIGDVPGAVQRQTEGNPLAAGLVAFGAGMLLATVIPVTRREADAGRRIEPQLSGVADEVKSGAQHVAEQLKPAAQEAVEDIRSSARDAADTVKDEASTGAQQVKDEAATAADNVRQKASSSSSATEPHATTANDAALPAPGWTTGEPDTNQTAYPPT